MQDGVSEAGAVELPQDIWDAIIAHAAAPLQEAGTGWEAGRGWRRNRDKLNGWLNLALVCKRCCTARREGPFTPCCSKRHDRSADVLQASIHYFLVGTDGER